MYLVHVAGVAYGEENRIVTSQNGAPLRRQFSKVILKNRSFHLKCHIELNTVELIQ